MKVDTLIFQCKNNIVAHNIHINFIRSKLVFIIRETGHLLRKNYFQIELTFLSVI